MRSAPIGGAFWRPLIRERRQTLDGLRTKRGRVMRNCDLAAQGDPRQTPAQRSDQLLGRELARAHRTVPGVDIDNSGGTTAECSIDR